MTTTELERSLFVASKTTYDLAKNVGVRIDVSRDLARWPHMSPDDPQYAHQCDNKAGYLSLDQVLSIATKRMRSSGEQLRVYSCPAGLHLHISSQPKRSEMYTTYAQFNQAESMTFNIGQYWESIRGKHNGKLVKIISLTPRAVNVLVIRGGGSQSNRRVRNKKEHIGQEEFRAHYAPLEESKRTTVASAAPPRSIPLSELISVPVLSQPQEQFNGPMPTLTIEKAVDQTINRDVPSVDTETNETYDFKIDEILERTVRALKRWGGKPVKSYVITQYVSKDLSAKRTSQLIDYGVKRGLLESWTVTNPTRPNQVSVMVGLTGGSRTSERPDGGYPGVPMKVSLQPNSVESKLAIIQQQSDAARANIKRGYERLTETQREEIARLAAEGETTLELQKAYGVMGGVIGMIKREHGLKVTNPIASQRHRERQRVQKLAELTKPQLKVRPAIDTGRLANTKPLAPHAVAPTATPAEAKEMRDALDLVTEQTKTHPVTERLNRIAKTAAARFSSHESSQTSTFNVTVLVMRPTEHTLSVQADSMEAALQQVRSGQAEAGATVLEVLSVNKVRD